MFLQSKTMSDSLTRFVLDQMQSQGFIVDLKQVGPTVVEASTPSPFAEDALAHGYGTDEYSAVCNLASVCGFDLE
jgi:hypothetical protein